ncbi:probable phosphoglycerate mutase [Austwickia chelonae]|uniref:Phosphoglycerate mutase family protein n=1 Tax=Austwickia chelonae NBRC 105200 TaxID=1184607 RepID=K6W3X7_9MICO|nr:histidine phosphatase family protein [Austwickia chelonae]GAB76492.1 phosphoglycerate mutase family protein [Austwickia chelonae NBRC 105200]SEW25668.1 probable phosphoglycerate mutase [Austwickia chelonae]
MSLGVVTDLPPRRLVVLRHGLTDFNERGIWQGHLDTELNETGLAQADLAASTLARHDLDRILSSDLTRALRTAQVVAQVCGLEVEQDPRLREIHVGSWQGMDSVAVEKAFPGVQARLAAGEDLARGGDGERVSDVVLRAREAVDDLLAVLRGGECALVVTHGVCARALVADLCGVDQCTAWMSFGGLANCAWAELVESTDRWRLVRWNVEDSAPNGPLREGHGY